MDDNLKESVSRRKVLNQMLTTKNGIELLSRGSR